MIDVARNVKVNNACPYGKNSGFVLLQPSNIVQVWTNEVKLKWFPESL